MEDRAADIINKLNNLSTDQDFDERCIYLRIEDINYIALFNVDEVDLAILTLNFNNWLNIEDNNINNNDYQTMFPQCKICCIRPNVYEINFEFYDENDSKSNLIYQVCTDSLKQILNNVLNCQIKITYNMLNDL